MNDEGVHLNPGPAGSEDARGENIEDEVIDTLDDTIIDEDRPRGADAGYGGANEASGAARVPMPAEAPTHGLCVSCRDEPGTAKSPCGHAYYADCLTGVLRMAITGIGAFPPHCCRQEIVVRTVRHYLDLVFVL